MFPDFFMLGYVPKGLRLPMATYTVDRPRGHQPLSLACTVMCRVGCIWLNTNPSTTSVVRLVTKIGKCPDHLPEF